MKPFDYVNAITQSKKDLMRGTDNDDLAEKGYNPWLTNNALSQFPDTILHANMMNQYHQLENRPQYLFLLNSVRPKKRWSKWAKSTRNEDLDIVCSYYNCNATIGLEYLSLLSSEQLKIIKKQQETGGIKK